MEKKTKRLEILEQSLIKKNELLDIKLQKHFSTVAQANGQPLNDKKCGKATFKKWDKQGDAIREAQQEIKKTEEAIEREKMKIAYVENTEIPSPIKKMVEQGILNQWRKYPTRFFVKGVEKARIIWDTKKSILSYSYFNHIKDEKQKKLFKEIYNRLNFEVNT